MKLAIYTECVSPHQLPMAKEVARMLGADNFCNIYDHPLKQERIDMGWDPSVREKWEFIASNDTSKANEIIGSAEVLISSSRNLSLFKHRSKRGLLTIYYGERWFKPRLGMWRLFLPSYFRMAWQFVKLLTSRDNVLYFPMGIHAAWDMARLCGLMNGDLRCLFRAPKLEFERKPGGRIWVQDEPRNIQNTRKYCLDKMRMWGYFVESSKLKGKSLELGNGLVNGGQSLVASEKGSVSSAFEAMECGSEGVKVLWVGRLLRWKRVDTIIKAVGECAKSRKITLDIYGIGPEEAKLKKLAMRYGDVIKFYPPVAINEVRKLMREHDVYVLSSNAYEGWGAVVSEAIEEGMAVIGTYEAGSSGTVLPESNLFHVGDWQKLQYILRRGPKLVDAKVWSAVSFAKALLKDTFT